MAKTNFKTIDEYLAQQPDHIRAILKLVRSAILEAVPDAVETISYQIPCFKLMGKPVLFFAGWKQHYSVYPASDLAEAFKEELAHYEVSKGTVRFPLVEPVPIELIKKIARFRAAKIVE